MFRRLLPLCAAFALLGGTPVSAQGAGTFSEVVRQIAALPAAELLAKLKAGHGRVDRALADRQRKNRGYKAAVARRDQAASAIETLKKRATSDATLQRALQQALVLDEEADVARSSLMAAEARVAKEGAELLRLYDAVLHLKGREVESLGARDARRGRAVAVYRALAAQRDQVRGALRPVLDAGDADLLPALRQVRASSEDDVETLLEKADLARDLEDRFMRRAEAVRRRILELEAEQALARDVVGMVRNDALFDENDRRLIFEGRDFGAGPLTRAPLLGGGLQASPMAAGGDVAVEESDSMPPPSGANNRDQNEGAEVPPSENQGGVPAPADPNLDADGDFAFEPGVGAEDDGVTNAPPVSAPTPVAPAPEMPLSSTEQIFLGSGRDAEASIARLMAEGKLSLKELKRLEKRLQNEAKRMRGESNALKTEVKRRVQERR
jgi:hypothetical protein